VNSHPGALKARLKAYGNEPKMTPFE